MAKFSASQLKSKMRSIQSKFNSDIRRAESQFKRGVNEWDRAVRQYNSMVRKNEARIKTELAKMNNFNMSRSEYVVSVRTVHDIYNKILKKYNFYECKYGNLLERIEEENANNLEVANVVMCNEEPENGEYSLEETKISNKLKNISMDLDDRWKGAIYALNPKNPDAARHFCTSTREIFIQLIDDKADNKEVVTEYPNCEKTEKGTPTRRFKIKYLLLKKGIAESEIEEFIFEDIENILSLLLELNGGTHGNAGKYTVNQLKSIKKRVESGLQFLCECIE